MRTLCFILLTHATLFAALPEELEARLRMARQIAREMNDRDLVAKVEKLGRHNPSDAQVREIEKSVGIDAGGWSMAGQPLFHPTPEMLLQHQPLTEKLTAAMLTDDPAQVRMVTDEMRRVLGDQVGVPDGRRAGRKSAGTKLSEAERTKLFFDALSHEARSVRELSRGKPMPDQMVRLYGYLLASVCEIRPFAIKHHPSEVENLDRLAKGVTAILLKLQQPEGHFPFPDLRGKNIRFGDMITKQVNADTVQVRDGWVITSDPSGGTQFDTSVCGVALLRAGELYQNTTWRDAGVRAADWAAKQKCCPNFNYNAFSISLLAEAYRATKQVSHLDSALKKLRVGVAPGQAANGRWVDAHNARSVYHVIILRSLGDLGRVMPESMTAELNEVKTIATAATKALIDEFDAMGITVDALPELLLMQSLGIDEPRLSKTVQDAASVLIEKSSKGDRTSMNMALSALPRVPQP